MKLCSALLSAAIALGAAQTTSKIYAHSNNNHAEASMSVEIDTMDTKDDLPQRYPQKKRSGLARGLKFINLGGIVTCYDASCNLLQYLTTCSRRPFTMPDRYQESYKKLKQLMHTLNEKNLLSIKTIAELEAYCLLTCTSNKQGLGLFEAEQEFITFIRELKKEVNDEVNYLTHLLAARARKKVTTDGAIIKALTDLLSAYKKIDSKLMKLVQILTESKYFKDVQACELTSERERGLANTIAQLRPAPTPPVVVNLNHEKPVATSATA